MLSDLFDIVEPINNENSRYSVINKENSLTKNSISPLNKIKLKQILMTTDEKES